MVLPIISTALLESSKPSLKSSTDWSNLSPIEDTASKTWPNTSLVSSEIFFNSSASHLATVYIICNKY